MTVVVRAEGKAWSVEFDETWTESQSSRGSCPFDFNGHASFGGGGDVAFSTPLHYSLLDSGTGSGGHIERLRAFDGALICGTGFVGTITKSLVERGPAPSPGPPGTISTSARGSVSLTLRKDETASPPATIPTCTLGN
jgi:hypothetical protein